MTTEVTGHRAAVRWLTPSVLGFGLASFLSDTGHESATSALPALLVTLGAAPAALGIIEGLSDGLSSFAKLAGGFWADRPRLRKPIAVTGYLATGASVGIFGLATSWLHVLLARGVGWFARGVRGPARDAMLADAVPAEAVGRAFGFHRAMDTAGAVAGPLLATLLLAAVPLRGLFYLSVIPGVLSALAFTVLVRGQGGKTAVEPQPFWRSLGALPPPFRQFLVAVFLFGVGDFARTLLILRATTLLAPSRGAAAAGVAVVLYAGHNLLYAAACYPVGLFADRMNPRRLLVLGYVFGTATAVLAAFASPSILLLAVLFAVAGLTLAFEDTLEGALTAQLVPGEVRGTGYGALAATNGIGDLLSSSVVGLIWTAVSPQAAFGFAALLCLGGTVVLAASVPPRARA